MATRTKASTQILPPFAAHLLDFIGSIEAPQGYDTVYGNNQKKLVKPVTKMTIAEVQAEQPGWSKRFGSSATGRYQFMHATLRDLIKERNLNIQAKFDEDVQDELGFALLQRRGYDKFVQGTIGVTNFGKQLAMEWASLPVLEDTQGAHRQVTRGQSYYAGDGLNKSLVAPERVEAALRAKMPGAAPDAPMPVPRPPPPIPARPPKPSVQEGFAAAVLVMLAGIAGWFADHWAPIVMVLVMGIAGGLIVRHIKRNRRQ